MSKRLSMDQAFIRKLTEAVEANLSNEHFGVDELANEVGMSRSQIHRKLKSITNQSASQFIRELRLEKAKEMLLQDTGTVSEIAYQVGFGSPTYFNTCFHEYFGFPPGEFKKQVPGDIEKTEAIEQSGSVTATLVSQPTKKVRSGQKHPFLRKALLISFSILIIAALTFFIYHFFIGEGTIEDTSQVITDKSIAVLPLRNLSEDLANQYFADGMMEELLNNLSGIRDFKIISRTSSEKYRESNKSLPQIAEELRVSYVIRGSVQKYNDKAKISIQLIDARKDQYLWSENFNLELKDIFIVQSEIAKQIAKELKTVLSPEEREQIEKTSTKDPEAYKLYLKGRFFWHRRTKEGLKTSIEYFNQALSIDPDYSLAYAGLADAYQIMAFFGWYPRKEGYAKGKEYAGKALKIDKNLAEAHATLGIIAAEYDWNWEVAEKELKLALELNPNYATAHQWYSGYLIVTGKKEEARKHINRALELNPHSIIMHIVSLWQYFGQRKYSEAIKEAKKVNEFEKNRISIDGLKYAMYVKEGNDFKVIEVMQQDTVIIKALESDSIRLMDLYEENGIEGIVSWRINFHLKNKHFTYFSAAQHYMWIDNKEAALDYLEKAFESHNLFLPQIKYHPDFEALRTEPRFIALLKKMNLEGY